jgi:heme A synthase
MKTLGRILIILLAAAIVTGGWVALVNGIGANVSTSFDRPGGDEFRPQQQGNQPPAGFPERGFPQGERPDRERGGGSMGRFALGMVKNVGIVAVLVALIVLPKSLFGKKRKNNPQADEASLESQS